MTRQRPSQLKQTGKLWIFCEGRTERRYFNQVRVKERVRIKIFPVVAGVTRADQIIGKAQGFSKNEFRIGGDVFDEKRDIIACVFDKDDNNTDAVFDDIRSMDKKDIRLIYSNPSFEYWIICHDGFYDSSGLTQKKVYDLVKSKMGIDAKKDQEIYRKTKDRIDTAIKNAKEIERRHLKNNTELISRDSPH